MDTDGMVTCQSCNQRMTPEALLEHTCSPVDGPHATCSPTATCHAEAVDPTQQKSDAIRQPLSDKSNLGQKVFNRKPKVAASPASVPKAMKASPASASAPAVEVLDNGGTVQAIDSDGDSPGE